MTGGRRMAVAAWILIAGLGLAGCGFSFQTLPQLGSASSFAGYPLHAVFANVQNLATNAKVRYGDAVIGDVTSVTARQFQADVTLKVRNGLRLPTGTTAQVLFETPLGDEYVQLTPPHGAGGPYLAPGATIGPARTSAAPTVADTLAALGAVLYGSGLGQARTVITSVNQILGGNQGPTRQLIANLDTTLGSLSANDAHIDQALAAASGIVTALAHGQAAVADALDTLPPAAAAVSADNAQLQQLLTGINQLSPIVTDVLAQSGQNLIADVSQAAPILQSLESVAAQYGTDAANFSSFARAIERDSPHGYVQVNVDSIAAFPSAEPIPGLAPLVGCTTPTPPSECPPGTSLVTLLTAGLP